jgi:DNA-binding MarR family transcriptional regulator
MIDTIAQHWLRVFDHNTAFYSAVYWDLLTRLWQANKPVRRTDALKFMTSVKSAATASKYLNEAIRQRLLQEYPNPQDARSKVLELSPDFRARLDTFFDHAVEAVRQANQGISHKGPVPDLG